MSLPWYLTDKAIADFIRTALAEDIGEGDHSTLGSVPADVRTEANLIVKGDGIIAGVALAEKIFKFFDPQLTVRIYKNDGAPVKRGDVAFVVEGPGRSILSTERVVLNCLQRMSGIATYTHKLCLLIAGTRAELLDTRKTTPNFRIMEKWAVHIGGARNHRLGLYDMIMLKDNHVDLSGGISNALERTKQYLQQIGKDLKIEVETRSLQEVDEALRTSGVDIIMLDNMPVTEMAEAVKMISGKCATEASGGITEENLREVAMCGVDYISIGALTHSAKSLDLSLKVSHKR